MLLNNVFMSGGMTMEEECTHILWRCCNPLKTPSSMRLMELLNRLLRKASRDRNRKLWFFTCRAYRVLHKHALVWKGGRKKTLSFRKLSEFDTIKTDLCVTWKMTLILRFMHNFLCMPTRFGCIPPPPPKKKKKNLIWSCHHCHGILDFFFLAEMLGTTGQSWREANFLGKQIETSPI